MAKKKTIKYKWDLFFQRLQENIFRPKRQTKDILFRLVFGNDRQALLQLYNVLHGTAYTDPHELQIVTLDNAIYISRKNDLAFLLAGSTEVQQLNVNNYLRKADQSVNLELHEGDCLYLTSNHKVIFSKDIMPFLTGAYYINEIKTNND